MLTLVNTEQRKIRSKFVLWILARPLLPREASAPHSRHIPPALFRSGKGLWSQYESSNAERISVLAPLKKSAIARCVLWPLGLGSGVDRGATASRQAV